MQVAHWNIAKRGDPPYATKKYEKELSNSLKNDGITVERMFRPEGRLRGSTACSWVLNYRTLDADIVHGTFQTVAPAAFIHPPDRLVVTVHDVAPLVYESLRTDLSAQLQWALTPTALERADRLIAISSFTKDELVSRTEVDPNNVQVIPQGVNHDLYRPMSQARARRQLDLDPEAAYILIVASNAPHKRLDLVKQVFRVAQERRDDIRLLKAGYGTELSGKAITSVDWLPEIEMPLLYNSADVYLHTSEYEGFGLPVLEAMACGVPVVVNDRASLPEVAGEERVVDIRPDTIESVAERVLDLFDEKPDEAALKRSERFSWQRTARETYDVYCELLDK